MRFLVLLGVLLVVATGCGSSPHPADPATPVRPHAASTIAWGVIGVSDVPTLDPALASDPTSLSVASLVYGGLVRLDGSLHVIPDGAARWTISRDGKTYTFHLRRGLRFASGAAVTAQDFVSSLRAAIGASGTSSTVSAYLAAIARGAHGVPRITAPAPRTVQIVLQRPTAHFLAELAFPISFIPDPSLVTQYGPSWTDHAAGFGPYRVAVWRHSTYLRLVRNRYYYGGTPAVKSITLQFEPDEATALQAYGQHTLDVVSGLAPAQTFPGDPSGLRRARLLAMDYLAFNTDQMPFKKADVRRAFAAVWSPAFVQHAMGRAAFAASSILPAGFGLNPVTWKPAKSPARYLAAAGFAHGRHFPQVTVILPRDPALHALALTLQRSWQRYLQVNVTVRQLNLSNYVRVLDARTFDLAFVRWGADYPDPQDFLGTQLGTSSDNVTGWAGKRYDALVPLADSYNPVDPRRSTLFRRAERLAATRVPYLPMDEPAESALVRPGIVGISISPLGALYIDPSTVHAPA
jgi:oligopeptide transport system substrate-binding protein